MISTTTIIERLEDIPKQWAFENYLNLGEELNGQSVKINSIFSAVDKTPSMVIFLNETTQNYNFKDFSSGKSGSAVSLVQEMFQLPTKNDAVQKIIADYKSYLLKQPFQKDSIYTTRSLSKKAKYKVTEFKTRQWTEDDGKYWLQYHIDSKLLERYQIKPLLSYTMAKKEEEKVIDFSVHGPRLYGYFRIDGSIYKIYQPMIKDCKFITVTDYIQGVDQLTFKLPNLIICSSMKDMLDFIKLGFKTFEVIAPSSENTIISQKVINAYKGKYNKILTLFDNDSAGILAMEEYKKQFDISFVHLDMTDKIDYDDPFGLDISDVKDLSDCCKAFGILEVRNTLVPQLKKLIGK